MVEEQHSEPSPPPDGVSRRHLLKLGGAAVVGTAIGGSALWWKRHHERGQRAAVFIGRAERYDAGIKNVIREGLQAIDFKPAEVAGKRVLLKPNLVETAVGQSHINTHPQVVVAAAEAFRALGAAEVIVGEGQGHRRDSWLVLSESGMEQALNEAGLPYVDLNHDELFSVPNAGPWTDLTDLRLPQTLRRADVIVSMPKLKTHHHAGVTCSMKNLFGVMPGIAYGWPKNVLHRVGIGRSILDINATVRPHLAIVDGVVGMEGDGPIMGRPKPLGAVVVGRNLTAVDATCTRLMGLNPLGVEYLRVASGRYGPVYEHNIEQRGEAIAGLRTSFEIIDLPHLAPIKG